MNTITLTRLTFKRQKGAVFFNLLYFCTIIHSIGLGPRYYIVFRTTFIKPRCLDVEHYYFISFSKIITFKVIISLF